MYSDVKPTYLTWQATLRQKRLQTADSTVIQYVGFVTVKSETELIFNKYRTSFDQMYIERYED